MEICVEGFWGTVCDSGFGREEAMVLCRQLDMNSLGIYLTCNQLIALVLMLQLSFLIAYHFFSIS